MLVLAATTSCARIIEDGSAEIEAHALVVPRRIADAPCFHYQVPTESDGVVTGSELGDLPDGWVELVLSSDPITCEAPSNYRQECPHTPFSGWEMCLALPPDRLAPGTAVSLTTPDFQARFVGWTTITHSSCSDLTFGYWDYGGRLLVSSGGSPSTLELTVDGATDEQWVSADGSYTALVCR